MFIMVPSKVKLVKFIKKKENYDCWLHISHPIVMISGSLHNTLVIQVKPQSQKQFLGSMWSKVANI